MCAGFDQQGNYPVLIAIIVESGRQFPFDPLRFHRRGSEDDRKPIAPKKCLADLVLPLLRAPDMMFAVPDRYVVTSQVARQTKRERLVAVTNATGKARRDQKIPFVDYVPSSVRPSISLVLRGVLALGASEIREPLLPPAGALFRRH